jgi:hypothetical protein
MLIDPYINQGISYHNSPGSYLCNHMPLQEGNDALQERNDALLTPPAVGALKPWTFRLDQNSVKTEVGSPFGEDISIL